MKEKRRPSTNLSYATADTISMRGKDLVKDLMGNVGFAGTFFLMLTGKLPTPGQALVFDTVLIALMDHALSRTAIASRLVYLGAPEALQGAIVAGLLGVGSRNIGTMEGCGAILKRIVAAGDRGVEEARAIIVEHKERKRHIPGFGSTGFKPDDPRTPKLLEVARQNGVQGPHMDSLLMLGKEVDASFGKHLTINITGGIAAVLSELGVPASIMRGVAVVSRCAGLVAQLREEQLHPVAGAMSDAVNAAVPYEAESGD